MRTLQISLSDPRYPELLRNIYKPPAVLNVRGELPDFSVYPPVAIVGSRKPTEYGQAIAFDIASNLSKAGFTIISGLAYGIDSVAHRAALKNKGITIAVLGSGLDNVQPKAHLQLAEEIIDNGGAVISEYGPSTPGFPKNFPERNRIVTGLSLGTIIVEASLLSGTLISARLAMEQGREVFAVPGRAGEINSAGPNGLLKDGAGLCESAQDVIDALLPRLSNDWKSKFAGQSFGIGAKETQILRTLYQEPLTPDEISARTGVPPNEVLAALTMLEMSRLVLNKGGKFERQKVD